MFLSIEYINTCDLNLIDYKFMRLVTKKKNFQSSSPSCQLACHQQFKHVPLKQEQKSFLEQLIEFESKTSLSKINRNYNSIKYVIFHICTKYNLNYNYQFGCICAHVSQHYNAFTKNSSIQDLEIIQRIIHKYSLIFFQNQKQLQSKNYYQKNSRLYLDSANQQNLDNFKSFEELLTYGVECMKFGLRQKYKQIFDLHFEDRMSQLKLQILVKRYLKSMFFQYIPSIYSNLLINIYLENKEHFSSQEYNWIQNNKQRWVNLQPYHDFFQILVSLTYHLAFRRNPINFNHFIEMASNCFMGVAQWPVVLGSRNVFDLP